MIYKLQESGHDNEAEIWFCKTSGLNNHKTYLLKQNRFNVYLVLFFSDLNKAQV